MSTEIRDERGKFLAWIAFNDEGKPVCLGGENGGISITAYPDDRGRIVGVILTQETDILGAFGWIPAARLIEEVDYYNEQ